MDPYTPLVLDIGSGSIKAGIAGEDAPRYIDRSIIGRPKCRPIIWGVEIKDLYIGEEA